MATHLLSWTPQLRDGIYCSPACGGGCRKAAFDAATANAEALAARLGAGWQAHVWENLGWHYAAISTCGRWKVHAHTYRGEIDGYTAFLGDAGTFGGRWALRADTPEEAVARTREAARKDIAYYASLLDLKLPE